MTAQEFNDLPLAARLYIEKQQGCLSCGNSQDIATLYNKYLIMQKKSLFTLRTGAVPYKTKNGSGVLYPIHPKDTEEVIKGKLKEALIVHGLRPDKFTDFDEAKIKAILAPSAAQEPAAEKADDEKPVKQLHGAEKADDEKPVKQLHGAAKVAAEAKAAKEANELA